MEVRSMTEEQWNASTEPAAMLEFVRTTRVASERKLRLFACACCRRVWHLLGDNRVEHVVVVSEQVADGEAVDYEVNRASAAAREVYQELGHPGYAAYYSLWLSGSTAVNTPTHVAWHGACAVGHQGHHTTWEKTRKVEAAAQADLLRDILGNPFRPLTIAPACRTHAVVALAQAAYDDRNLPYGTLKADHLAALTDALEESRCHDAFLLGHLRGSGQHWRGCFALDLVLGKN
jgi:hypothetical protein